VRVRLRVLRWPVQRRLPHAPAQGALLQGLRRQEDSGHAERRRGQVHGRREHHRRLGARGLAARRALHSERHHGHTRVQVAVAHRSAGAGPWLDQAARRSEPATHHRADGEALPQRARGFDGLWRAAAHSERGGGPRPDPRPGA